MLDRFEMDLTFERGFLPARSSNIKIVTFVEGEIEEQAFRHAVAKLARKHPFLRSRILLREDGSARITTEGGKTPKVVIASAEHGAGVLAAIHQEDRTPADWGTDSTSRFILVKGPNGADVVISYLHHVVADGRSAAFVTAHLLHFIANPEKDIEALAPISLIENAPSDVELPESQVSYAEALNHEWASEKVTFNAEDFLSLARRKYALGPDAYVDRSLTREDTSALREKARLHGVSVNDVLLAATLLAKEREEEAPSPRALGFAVDVRNRLTKDAGEACNLLASSAMVAPEYREDMPFWDLARGIHTQTQAALQSNQGLFGSRMMSQIIDPTFNDAMYMFQHGAWEGTPLIRRMGEQAIPVGAVLTNLGGTQLSREYDGVNPLKVIDAVFYPPVGVEHVVELGASSLLGRLHIVTLSRPDAENRTLKEKMIPRMIQILQDLL